MNLLHYDIFRNIADGMIITMILYALLSYFKNKNTAFLLYGTALLFGLVEFYMGDLYYKKGIYDIYVFTFLLEITCFTMILYWVFVLKIFEVHIQERHIFNKIILVIVTLTMTASIDFLLKLNNNNLLAMLWVYGIAIVICTTLNTLIFYHLYQLKYLFMKYYLVGSAIITVGWTLNCIFQAFPNSFPNLITFDNNNAFTFPCTYARLGMIFESIFMFIGISESHKLSELSNIDLKRKILLSIEEKSNDDKFFINVKHEILVKVNTTFNQHLRQSSILAEETIQLLTVNNNARAKENLLLFNNLTSQSIQTIRNIVKEFNEQNSFVFNQSIESKAFEISKYCLSEKNVSFDIYVNESALWQTIGNDFEKQILTFYEKILEVFIKYKDFLHLIANFAMHNDGNIFIIIQDDGSRLASKHKMVRELNLISSQLLYWQGKIAYSIEDSSNSTVRLDFASTSKSIITNQ